MDYNTSSMPAAQSGASPPTSSTSMWRETGTVNMTQPQNTMNAPNTVVNVTHVLGDETRNTPALTREIAIPPPRADHEIYYHQLLTKRRGSPLWLPGPGSLPPIQYRSQGISIGDVGIITHFGRFDFLFNIFQPASHPINSRGVPESFIHDSRALEVDQSIIYDRNTYLTSSSVSTSSVNSSGLIFESTAQEAAILTMPEGALTEDLLNGQVIRDCIAKNARAWYEYARCRRGRIVQNGEIRVVVGWDKVRSWGIATSTCTSGQSASLAFKIEDETGTSRAYCWQCIGSGSGRVGPPEGEISNLRGANGATPQNQCVFARTMNFTLAGHIWDDYSATAVQQEPVSRQDNSQGLASTHHSAGGGTGNSSSGVASSHHQPSSVRGGSHTLQSVTFDATEPGIDHPSSSIHRRLLENYPNATIAITQDADWISALTDDDKSMPQSEVLCARILESRVIYERDGMVSIQENPDDPDTCNTIISVNKDIPVVSISGTPAETRLGDPLPRTMDTIRQSCGRFRVLVLGKEGVGKSSLINSIFKVDSLAKVFEYTAGEADIEEEMFSQENDFLVLHDSRGYGPGKVDNFVILTEFINKRTGNADARDRLHAIWLCIATPIAGARVLETWDERIFQDFQGKVVVFTRYDDLVMKRERQLHNSGRKTEDDIESLAKSNAYQSFKEDCITPITKVNDKIPYVCVSVKPKFEETLQNLVNTTLQHINPGKYPLPHVLSTNPSKLRSTFRNLFSFKPSEKAEPINTDGANSVGIMLATAQRVALDPRITESVNVGRKNYWGLGSGAHFLWKDLRRCLEVIHDDIVLVWNFRNLPMLRDNVFMGRIADLADLGSSPNDHIVQNTTNIAGAVDACAAIAAGSANPVGFTVGPIVSGPVFAKPGLQCFMAYIVDLTIIMQMIFVISQGRADGVVRPEEVEDVLKRFEVDQRSSVHRDIKQFVRQMSIFKVGRDVVFEKIVNLIDHYRVKEEDGTRPERLE